MASSFSSVSEENGLNGLMEPSYHGRTGAEKTHAACFRFVR